MSLIRVAQIQELSTPDNWAQRKEKELRRNLGTTRRAYEFVGSCVSLDGPDITKMIELERQITYLTFQKWLPQELKRFAETFGYEKNQRVGLSIRNDWHLGFYKSKYQGREAYFIRHSAIEYIWARPVPPKRRR